MTVQDAIAQAESILPGEVAPEGAIDPRWQAVIAVAEFIEREPEAVWVFALKWGSSQDQDLRAAIATRILEHLLEHHFDRFIDRVEAAACHNECFANTVQGCWLFGQATEPTRSARLQRLQAGLHRGAG